MSAKVVFALYMITIMLIIFRNSYTLIIMRKADKLIDEYIKSLSYKEYDSRINYYKQMKRNYFAYMFSFWLWGVYDAIAPEYVNMIKYIEEENKYVKKRTF